MADDFEPPPDPMYATDAPPTGQPFDPRDDPLLRGFAEDDYLYRLVGEPRPESSRRTVHGPPDPLAGMFA